MQHSLHNLHAPILFRKKGIPSEKVGGDSNLQETLVSDFEECHLYYHTLY